MFSTLGDSSVVAGEKEAREESLSGPCTTLPLDGARGGEYERSHRLGC